LVTHNHEKKGPFSYGDFGVSIGGRRF